MIDRWITDDEPSPTFPHYTRANADEVGPDPFSPLGWTLGWVKGCIPGVARGFIDYGVVHPEELRPGRPEVFGNWGGYFYNQLTLPRLLGVRMPGASPDAMDRAYFGDHPGVPAFEMKPDYEDAELSEKLTRSMSWVMSTDDCPEMDEWAETARRFRAERPDLTSLSDAQLLERGRQLAPLIAETWRPYCIVTFAASVGAAAVAGVLEPIGRAADSMRLISAVGGVESADASIQLWDLGRMVARSPVLTRELDLGVDGLLERLSRSGDADASAFTAGLSRLLSDHGHRGPNEWDMMPDSWETRPELVLGMIDAVRHQDEDRSPAAAAARGSAERVRLQAALEEALSGYTEALGTLRAGIHSAAVFFPLRERGKNACIRLINEAKVCFFELGRRLTERGLLDHKQQIFMLLDEELDSFLSDPHPWLSVIRDREADFERLRQLEPPYIIDAAVGVPPISTWPERDRAREGADRAGAGEVLMGAGASPGSARGRAKIVLDPSEPGDLAPGDVIVVHTSDPSWTPLYMVASAVVCDVGAVASHAAIVSRELGIPCAVSVVGATSRIPDGAMVHVDGATGVVTIESIPA